MQANPPHELAWNTHARRSVPQGTIYLRASEVVVYCRCGARRIRSWERRGILRAVRDADGRRFYRITDLDAVMVGGPAPSQEDQVQPAPAVELPPRIVPAVELPYTEPRTTGKPPRDSRRG